MPVITLAQTQLNADARLQPKIGLLGMVVDPILAGHVEDAYVVPVSIYYDGAQWPNTKHRCMFW